MNLVRCQYGHFFDGDIYLKCPHCAHSNANHLTDEERLKMYEPIGGKWLLDSLIGEGGSGKVYKVVNANDPHDIAALKVISINKSDFVAVEFANTDPAITVMISENTVSPEEAFRQKKERVKSEIQLLQRLNDCEYLINIHGDYQYEREDGEAVDLMIEMEFLTPITDYFLKNKFSEAELLKIAVDICEALEYLHKKGIIHGAVKPENIYRSETGVYKLGDFGVARKEGQSFLGWTIPYCAPELLSTGNVGIRTDIYSLGVSLYYLAGGNINTVMSLLQSSGFSKLVRISSEFSDVIMKACASDPKKRIKNASVFLKMLRKIDAVSEESIPFIRKLPSASTFNADKSRSDHFSADDVPCLEENRTEQMSDGRAGRQENSVKDNNLIYNIVVWLTFTCGLAFIPLFIFCLLRSCFKPDFPYVNKVITELLYFGLTLSIVNIKDLFSLRLRYKPKTTYVLLLFFSLLILILTTVFFGIMTANDMSLLNGVGTGASPLLCIAVVMSIFSFCLGIFIQCFNVLGGEEKT